MSMREALENWLDKQQNDLGEWLVPCEVMGENKEGVRAACLKFAEDYEAKKIDEAEFLASLSNLTGKSLEEIEQVLSESTGGNPQDDIESQKRTEGEKIAQEIGGELIYNGPWMDGQEFVGHTFTDKVTGTTILCMDTKECKDKLIAKRRDYNMELPKFSEEG